MAMKSSGLALPWKPHPGPSERHRAMKLKRKHFLIDYDNHHLNQVPSALPSSPAALLLHSLPSPTLIYSTSPQGILLSWQNTGASHLQLSLPPAPITRIHTHMNAKHTHTKTQLLQSVRHTRQNSQTLQHALCVCAQCALFPSGEALNSILRCGVVHVYSFADKNYTHAHQS